MNKPTLKDHIDGPVDLSKIENIIVDLEEAIEIFEPPWLALPEIHGTPEQQAYKRGARDAYIKVVESLKKLVE